jgi:large subunit ribosomal protein L21
MAKSSEKSNILWTVAHFKGGDIKLVPNEEIVVDFIDKQVGESIEIENSKLAFMDDKIITDKSMLKKIVVTGTVLRQYRGPKLVVFKYRRRKNSCRKNGHRQDLTTVKIDSITVR